MRASVVVRVASLLGLSIVAGSAIVPAAELTIRGSDTMLVLNQELAGAFRRTNPGTTIEVIGGGSGLGIKALLEGKVELAACSRPLKPAEIEAFVERYGSLPLEIPIAMDGVAIYVHNHNPLTYISRAQLKAVLTGEIRNWSALGGPDRAIVFYNRNSDSGTYEFVREHVLEGEAYDPKAITVTTTATVTSAVARTPGGVGYGGVAYADGAHILRVRASDDAEPVFPTLESVSTGEYPLSRPLYFYVNPRAWTDAVERFLLFVLGDDGQGVVDFVGFFPISYDRRAAIPLPRPPGSRAPRPAPR